MIEQFLVFNKTGLVLWCLHRSMKLKGEPVNELIQAVLLEERTEKRTYDSGEFSMKWVFANELDLIFVVVYQKILQLMYVDGLLARVRDQFVQRYGMTPAVYNRPLPGPGPCFSETFNELHEECEMAQLARKPRKQRTFGSTEKGKELASTKKKKKKKKQKKKKKSTRKFASESDSEENEEEDEATDVGEDVGEEDGSESKDASEGKSESNNGADDDEDATMAAARERMMMRRRKGRKPGGYKPKPKKKKAKAEGDEARKKKKKLSDWAQYGAIDSRKKISSKDMSKLDRSAPNIGSGGRGLGPMGAMANQGESEVDAVVDAPRTEWIDEARDGESKAGDGDGVFGWLGSKLSAMTGNKPLEREDLDGVLDTMKKQLVKKNVSIDIAEELCDSVCKTLIGQKVGTFGRVKTMFNKALYDALVRVLTPKKSVDVLRSALQARREKRPFTVVFVGVNGVGKSTSLSKVCYYLLQKKMKVLIAACDTFRSGAVEQLKVHGRNLGVEIFDRGYAKDASGVARAAVAKAKREDIDCVLIDTAGRMQNNTSLMRELATLVEDNKPDLVLFVGEALVGNDGVDQLREFNKKLADYSTSSKPHMVDGIVLTKFDTIDDKVGAALSMVYQTGQPIVFVGVGQKYTHLRRLNVQEVIEKLFK